jgi:DNA helicase-2/ATP-dependent DNA helicase PcrA
VVEAVYELHRLIMQVLPQKAELPPAELLQFVFDATGFVEWLWGEFDGHRRLAGVYQLKEDAAEYAHLSGFLDYARQRTDGFFESGRGVQLSTIHAAKGLEFDAVLVVGLEEGTLPHARALRAARDPAEERRLCYVAMTRARDRLYMLCSRTRDAGGRPQPRRPSRYFGDLPRSLLEQRG